MAAVCLHILTDKIRRYRVNSRVAHVLIAGVSLMAYVQQLLKRVFPGHNVSVYLVIGCFSYCVVLCLFLSLLATFERVYTR